MQPPRPEGTESLVPAEPTSPAVPNDLHQQRWRLVRDLAVFQLKLLVDGLKDLVLSPVSMIAAIAGLLVEKDRPGQHFDQVMRMGHGFDRWLDLFGERRSSSSPALPSAGATPEAPMSSPPPQPPQQGLDAYISRVEQALSEQVRRGGLTTKAKDAIDRALDSLHESRAAPRSETRSDSER